MVVFLCIHVITELHFLVQKILFQHNQSYFVAYNK